MEPENNDEIKFENELEKLKLQAELGANFFSGSTNIPPEMETEWLKHIRAFEQSYQNVQEKPLAEILGNPEIKPLSGMTDEEVPAALDSLLELMADKGFVIDYDDDITEREIYRFICEDLMDYKFDAHDLPDMITHIMYEEFYPNHYKDIIRTCEHFCHELFKSSVEYLDNELDHTLAFANGVIMPRKVFVEKAAAWFSNYNGFKVEDILFAKPSFDLEQGLGHVDTYFKYDAICEDGSTIRFDGPGIFYLNQSYGYWFIYGMEFPGFKEWAFS